jgi:hypothetical protein
MRLLHRCRGTLEVAMREALRAIGIDPNEGRLAPNTVSPGRQKKSLRQDDGLAEQPALAAPGQA